MARKRNGPVSSFRTDKQILVSALNLTAATQSATTLFTATVPCRVRHVVTRGNITGITTPAFGAYAYAIVRVPQGYTQNNMSLVNATSLYTPEIDVLAYVAGQCEHVSSSTNEFFLADVCRGGRTTLQIGDSLKLIALSSIASSINVVTEFLITS